MMMTHVEIGVTPVNLAMTLILLLQEPIKFGYGGISPTGRTILAGLG